MTPINEFIVEIKESHTDEVKIKGTDVSLKVDVRFNQGDYTIRTGKVVAVPVKFDSKIKVGDTVIIDRNLVTFQVHGESLVNKSMFLVDEKRGWYRVPPDMIYLYKHEGDKNWTCPAPYVFIKPIEIEQTITKGGIIHGALDSYKGRKEQYGTIRYLNGISRELGLKEGDAVYYKKDREYEFKVDEELLYHMDNDDILGVFGHDPY